MLDVPSGRIVTSLPVGGEPEGVTISPNGRWAYVASEADNQVSVIDTAASEVVAQNAVGARPGAPRTAVCVQSWPIRPWR